MCGFRPFVRFPIIIRIMCLYKEVKGSVSTDVKDVNGRRKWVIGQGL